jgi:hypothetical protein
MASMYENLCGNYVVQSRAILKIVNVQWYKKNQMRAYEMSYKYQVYPTHTVAT